MPQQAAQQVEQVGTDRMQVQGEALGVTYQLTYIDEQRRDLTAEVEAIFQEFTEKFSIYSTQSLISKWNRVDSLQVEDALWEDLFLKYEQQRARYGKGIDPTQHALLDLWDFRAEGPVFRDSTRLRELPAPGFSTLRLAHPLYVRSDTTVQVTLHQGAKGLAVDVLADFLAEKGIQNFLINLGSLVRAAGVNAGGELWRIALPLPEKSAAGAAEPNFRVMALEDASFVTIGDYTAYYTDPLGTTTAAYVHPGTGFPVQHDLVQVSVQHKGDAFTAELAAWAAFAEGKEEFLAELEADGLRTVSVRARGETRISQQLRVYLTSE
ncbi:FAD:protein FMN transferase [Nitritalea halalkaliphila]|uniref:FAD:protein FMN transferase n=1 Tax=Nitritalea halalkaliphila TaxID=590849 RepID=UPI00138992E7|nr:FAD:protein FMN transferase [Nitritalea halalkaliphila]